MTESTSGELRVRPAREEDARQVSALAAQLGYVDAAAGFGERIRWLREAADQLVLVAESNRGEVVGWIHAFKRRGLLSSDDAEIGGLIVDERFRGRGVGRTLVAGAEDWAAVQGCGAIRVRSNVKRMGAPAFYAAAGYHEIKQQRVLTKAL